MKRYPLTFSLCLVVLMLLSMPFVSKAESGVSESDINIELNPQVPTPGADVTATLSSYATDLNKASIKWQDASGNVLSSGIGDVSYTISSGGPNTNISIQVSITPAGDSTPIIKQLSIHPSSVDILWQIEDSHTPPFYKGKALATSESIIKAVAMPVVIRKNTASNNNVYIWKLEQKNITKSSGYGKDAFEFKNSYLRDVEHIDVNASSVDGSFHAENTITIPILNSKLLFYLKNPDGVINYNQAVGDSTQIYGNESTLVAEPYFFPKVSAGGDVTYTWQINGSPINTPKNPTVLTFRPTGSGGYATISLAIEHASKLFQSVASSIKLNL